MTAQKGSNVIEAYCAISNQPITQADIRMGIAEEFEGRMVFARYTDRGKSLMSREDVKAALLDFHDNVIKEHNLQGKDLVVAAQRYATKHSIAWDDFDYAFKALYCILFEKR